MGLAFKSPLGERAEFLHGGRQSVCVTTILPLVFFQDEQKERMSKEQHSKECKSILKGKVEVRWVKAKNGGSAMAGKSRQLSERLKWASVKIEWVGQTNPL